MAPWQSSTPYRATAVVGALHGVAAVVHLYGGIDSQCAGVHGNAFAVRTTATTLQQYVCSDTP